MFEPNKNISLKSATFLKETAKLNAQTKPKLLEQIKTELRVNHYSRKTEEAYIGWIKRYILFHNKKHPSLMGKDEIQTFINYLAVEQNVSSSTQNQALQAILYLYKNILNKNVEWLDDIKYATRIKHLPVVFTRKETIKIFEYLNGVPKLVVSLLYGSGLRLSEALSLRIKDIDFEYRQIIVRDGKGEKDRHTVLPSSIIPELKKHLNEVYKQHKKDLSKGKGETLLPYALDKKYPNAVKEFGWQYAFPADKFIKHKENLLLFSHLLSASKCGFSNFLGSVFPLQVSCSPKGMAMPKVVLLINPLNNKLQTAAVQRIVPTKNPSAEG